MQSLVALNTSFRRSIKNSPFEVIFGMKPNGIPEMLGELNNKVRFEDGVHRTDKGSKANLEKNSSKTSEKTDERPAGAQHSCEEIKRNHDTFVDFSYHNKRENPSRASLKVTCLN